MGKTVGRIALIAAAVAVNFIPGAGTAISVALSSVGVVGAAGAATSIIAGITVAAIGATLSIGAGLLGLGPKTPPAESTVTTVKNPTPIRQYGYGRRRYYGSKILFETNTSGATVDVYAFIDDEADGTEQVYLNDDKVTISGGVVQALPDKRYQNSRVKAGFTLGATPNVAFSEVVARVPDIWNTNHRGDGLVTGYLIKEPEKEKDFLTTYPQGDNVELSVVIRGTKNIFDPRTGSTGYTENAILHLMHYLIEKRGYDYNRRFLPTIEMWKTAANVCDEAVPLKEGGTEPRYRSCVSYAASAKPKEVIASLLECCDGWFAPRGDGALVVYAGKLYTPTVTLGPDDIFSYNLPKGVNSEDRIDQLTVSYVSEEHDWSTVETTPWGVEGLRAEPFSPQTPSYSQNRRLAKRFYARSNQESKGSVQTNLSGRKARGHRYIYLDLREGGIDWLEGASPAIVEVKSVSRDFGSGGLAIEWVAVDPNIDAWNPATEQGEPAALGDRIAPQPLETPMIILATPLEDDPTGSVTLDVEGPELDGLTWFVRWRRQDASLWGPEQQYADIDDGIDVELVVSGLPADAELEFQAAYMVSDGRVSEWSPSFEYQTDAVVYDFDGGDASTEVEEA